MERLPTDVLWLVLKEDIRSYYKADTPPNLPIVFLCTCPVGHRMGGCACPMLPTTIGGCANCASDRAQDMYGVCAQCYAKHLAGQIVKYKDTMDKDDWTCGCGIRPEGPYWCVMHRASAEVGPLGEYVGGARDGDTKLDRRMLELALVNKTFLRVLKSKCEFKNSKWTFQERNVFQA